MIYKVIGLMSGSSLDGLDIAYVHLEEVRGAWQFEIKAAECMPYPSEWEADLRGAAKFSVPGFLRLHTSYGRYLGRQVQAFIDRNDLEHQIDFIASHGHTVFHDPEGKTTYQAGDGASIAAETGLPVVTDLRALDVALGGQGAPIVPVGDRLLFADYEYCLNLGGIANITILHRDGGFTAFDICPCNQVLDYLAGKLGYSFDAQGAIAATGRVLPEALQAMNAVGYFRKMPPKSLDNDFSGTSILPLLSESGAPVADQLRTAVKHIAVQIAAAVQANGREKASRLLVTGGGAMNTFLVHVIQQELLSANVQVVVPGEAVIKYKEAIIMALIGALRWREEENAFSSVTGARRNSIGGALWMGQG